MGSNSPVITDPQIAQGSPLTAGVSGIPIVLLSNKSCSSSVDSDNQGSTSTSVPLFQQGLLESQVTPGSQDSPAEPRKQEKKRTVFTQDQKLVLEEHFTNCTFVTKEQCRELAQRFGLREQTIKMWFRNKRSRQKQKNASEQPGNPGCPTPDRPASTESGAILSTSISTDSLCQKPDQHSPDQESNLSTPDQVPEDVGCRESPAREQRERQKDSELPGRSGHQSSGSSGLCQVSVPLSGPDISQPVQEGPLGVNSPLPHSRTLFTEPESISCFTQPNECLLNEFPAARGRSPGQAADYAFSASPTPAPDADSTQPLESSTCSQPSLDTATKSAERVKETPSVNSIPETMDYQDSTALQDQLFLQHLCELDAAIEPLSPPDFFENFSLLDFF